MKKIIIFLVCVVMIFSLSACGGNVKNFNVVDVESEIYTSDDISSAIETIKKEFDKDWKGCTLKEIYYAGVFFATPKCNKVQRKSVTP